MQDRQHSWAKKVVANPVLLAIPYQFRLCFFQEEWRKKLDPRSYRAVSSARIDPFIWDTSSDLYDKMVIV